MKKQHSKKQIEEAIAFWQNKLDKLNENAEIDVDETEKITISDISFDRMNGAFGVDIVCSDGHVIRLRDSNSNPVQIVRYQTVHPW